ncbi:MAG TPA: ankyrin repeat domain-containing protein [Gammaproteobacteria bacterium]|nr:ankyrin repeat domain-containing protein [Gammaproteobacteria bacterium]
MACSHVENCELFVQFALNPALEVWKMHYCQGHFQECIRFKRSTAGKPVPLTLLPNGKLLQADGMAKTDVGAAAMFNSIVKHRTRMVSSLLRTGANVDERNMEGKTPLMAAAELGFEDIVAILIDHGADRDATDSYGETAYEFAARNGHESVCQMLRSDQAA